MNLKTNPVIVSLSVVAFLLVFGASCGIGGWMLRAALESRAELAVVLDDSEFGQWLEIKGQEWLNEFLKKKEDFYNDGKDIPECLSSPMPARYHDSDFGLHPEREQEGG